MLSFLILFKSFSWCHTWNYHGHKFTVHLDEYRCTVNENWFSNSIGLSRVNRYVFSSLSSSSCSTGSSPLCDYIFSQEVRVADIRNRNLPHVFYLLRIKPVRFQRRVERVCTVEPWPRHDVVMVQVYAQLTRWLGLFRIEIRCVWHWQALRVSALRGSRWSLPHVLNLIIIYTC